MNENLTVNKNVVGVDVVLENCQEMHFSIEDFEDIRIYGLQTNLSKSKWDGPCKIDSYLYASGGVYLTIKKEANRTDKIFLSFKDSIPLEDSNPPFDYFLNISNIVRLCLVHEDESKTRIDVPYEVAMGASCWSEESIMQTAHLEDDGNLSIRIYGDADIEERKLANEEEIEKRKPRHDEKYYMNSRIKFTDLKAPRTTLELLWMTERYFSEYGTRLYADSSEADFKDATGYFNYVRDIFNIETIGELKQGERLI